MAALFPTTRWTMVLDATSTASRREEAFEELCRAYWQPLFLFARGRGYSREKAQDLTQEFFTRLLEKSSLGCADPNRGRFRVFLLTSYANFLTNENEKSSALKRGGASRILQLDALRDDFSWEPAHLDTSEKIFERRWALTVFERAARRLEREHSGRPDAEAQFDGLRAYLVGGPQTSYEDLADDLGTTPSALRMTVTRLRRRFGRILREEILDTVEREDEADEELRHVLHVLSSTAGSM